MQPKKTVAAVLLCVAVLLVGLTTYAQVERPYRDGTVWSMTFVKMKPGMESAYLSYIASDWKREQDAFKKEGFIVSYKILGTESHGSTDWNLLLMTEYKDMATLEANQAKMEAASQRLFGSDEKVRQGYKERLEIREIVGDRLAREVVLEPRAKQ